MRYIRVLLSSFWMFLFSLNGFAQSSEEILGSWMSEDGKGIIEIYKHPESSKYFGKIIWLKEPFDAYGNTIKDVNGKAVLNMINLKDFVYSDGQWTDGTVYDPESGKTYYSKLTLENKNKLKVRGSIDPMGWIGKTTYWQRYDKNGSVR